jgi:pseudouridine synthase
VIAGAGVASRRAAEALISAGRVSVNGQVIKELGTRADPLTDRIEVDGKPLSLPTAVHGKEQQFVYIALNKPAGVVSTVKDTHGRPTVLDTLEGAHLAERGLRVYPVGRLDVDTTGLLLLTNDGELTFRLTHPRYGIEKEYRALVRGRPGSAALQRLREGVEVEGETTAPARVSEIEARDNNALLSIVIHEGRKRQVRLMCAGIGHPVMQLERVRFGPIVLGDLPAGRWRYLATHEVHTLRKAVKLKPATHVEHKPARPGQKPNRGAKA